MDKEFSKLNAKHDDLLLDEYLGEDTDEEDDANYWKRQNQAALEERDYYRRFGGPDLL